MPYRIRILKTGECVVRNDVVFHGGDAGRFTRFFLYVWLIEGGAAPMLVDTGPKDIDTFNEGVAAYIPGGIQQRPEERTPDLLARAGVEVATVSNVFATHLHPDHYEYFDLFPKAQLVVNRRGFLDGILGVRRNVMQALAARWPESIHLAGSEEVLPGVRVFPLGCHSPCSQAIVVETGAGRVGFAGDVVYLYRNLEENLPIGWASPEEWTAAVERLRREADIIVPGHDPQLLERFPSGWIG